MDKIIGLIAPGHLDVGKSRWHIMSAVGRQLPAGEQVRYGWVGLTGPNPTWVYGLIGVMSLVTASVCVAALQYGLVIDLLVSVVLASVFAFGCNRIYLSSLGLKAVAVTDSKSVVSFQSGHNDIDSLQLADLSEPIPSALVQSSGPYGKVTICKSTVWVAKGFSDEILAALRYLR